MEKRWTTRSAARALSHDAVTVFWSTLGLARSLCSRLSLVSSASLCAPFPSGRLVSSCVSG